MDASEPARKLTDRLAERENVRQGTSPLPKPTQDSVETSSLEGIRHFFDESEFDVYTKENLGSESYWVAGQPCHGGYAGEPTRAGEEPGSVPAAKVSAPRSSPSKNREKP